MHFPTNGDHCTGDCIKAGEAIGAKTIELEWVQVHPTGLVKPDDPDAKIKFLASEALRGVGGTIKHNTDQEYVCGKGVSECNACLNDACGVTICKASCLLG